MTVATPPITPAVPPAAAPAPAAAAAAAPAPAVTPAAPPAAVTQEKAAPPAEAPTSLLEATAQPPKPGETPGNKQGAPEKYADFKLPDGMTLDAALAEKALPLFKKHNLSQEAAQEFASLQAEHVKAGTEALIASAEKQRAEQISAWQAETKKALGAEWQKELGYAGKALDAFWPPEIRKMLTASGLGDHPQFTAGLVKLGKSMSEATPGTGSGAGITDPKEATNRAMFPKMYDGNGNYIGGQK